ncbi:MAG: TetR/AcrR family transcriptional regulator [Caulobacter sp.]|nr:TetR/AcrR family transcriptional regulator [Caulobacter sp.]
MTARPAAVSATVRRQSAVARRERARARPQEILNAARDLFSRKGFEAARMDEVAAAAGVTKPAVYRYFPGKDRLIEALLEEDLAVPWRRLAEWIEAHQGPVADMLDGFGQRVGDLQASGLTRGYLMLAMDEGGRRPEIAGFIRNEILAPGLVVLGGAMARAMARGELTAGHDPGFLARLFFAPFLQASLGAVGYALPIGDAEERERYRQFHTAAFLRAFGA